MKRCGDEGDGEDDSFGKIQLEKLASLKRCGASVEVDLRLESDEQGMNEQLVCPEQIYNLCLLHACFV